MLKCLHRAYILMRDMKTWILPNSPPGSEHRCTVQPSRFKPDFLAVQWQRIYLSMQEIWVPSLGWEDPLEKEMSTHSSILACEIPSTEKPVRVLFMGLQRVQ